MAGTLIMLDLPPFLLLDNGHSTTLAQVERRLSSTLCCDMLAPRFMECLSLPYSIAAEVLA